MHLAEREVDHLIVYIFKLIFRPIVRIFGAIEEASWFLRRFSCYVHAFYVMEGSLLIFRVACQFQLTLALNHLDGASLNGFYGAKFTVTLRNFVLNKNVAWIQDRVIDDGRNFDACYAGLHELLP